MTSHEYNLWVRRSGKLTIGIALIIVIIKLFAAIDTNAASILASLMDATMDVAVSLLNFVALRYALKPADDDHRFGHGKAEAVMALFQAAFLAGAAFVLLYQGVNRIYLPAPIGAINNGIWAMLLCSALTLTLVLLQRWIIKKTGSLAVAADQAHYRSDLLMNAAVLLALYLVQNSLLWADAAIAILIALYLLFNAAQLLRESMVHLLDEELPEAERQQILQHLLQMPGVLGVEQLRTRRAGPRIFIQLRLLLPQDWSLQKAHQVTDLAEQQIAAFYRDAEVIIHPDPLPHAATKD
ncbi:cation diffusion facilitator family transporter [Rheinheimera tilapiae]|jgi:ferrous-iron efflux pump FieF|uniref:Cation diffusion facilitator family transporter n=1 Tax=Rheinheimera tilapiae TaxID=875043 RepID=A0ABV6BGF8_9GAMM